MKIESVGAKKAGIDGANIARQSIQLLRFARNVEYLDHKGVGENADWLRLLRGVRGFHFINTGGYENRE